MHLKYLKNFLLVPNQKFDLVVTGLGPESRARNIIEKYDPQAPYKIYVQAGLETDGLAFSENEKSFKSKDYIFQSEIGIYNLIKSIPHKDLTRPFSVLLDISCLYRPSFAEIFVSLMKWADHQDLEITIAYSLAQFTSPTVTPYPNEAIEPVHDFFSGWPSAHSNPTSLIVGLGYEPHKAEGASEYLDAREQWGFIPTSQVQEFLPQVEENNEHLLARLRAESHLVRYDVHDCERTFGQLELILSDLLRTTNPVVLPFGPKLFFSLCLLQGVLHPEVGVWHVTGEKNEQAQDRKSFGIEIAYQVGLSTKETD